MPVDTLVLHYTGMTDAAAAIARLRDPAAQVSAHYLVHEDGAILALVPEHRRAWHAGESYWRGHRDINARSVGVEIVNPGHAHGYRDFPPAQMAAVRDLCAGILARHPIPARNVVGHSDIAPARKQDPGEKFDWQWLARMGIGIWPDADGVPVDARAALGAIGYDDGVALPIVLRAFQRHWRPERCDGVMDPPTAARLAGLYARCGRA